MHSKIINEGFCWTLPLYHIRIGHCFFFTFELINHKINLDKIVFTCRNDIANTTVNCVYEPGVILFVMIPLVYIGGLIVLRNESVICFGWFPMTTNDANVGKMRI